MSSMICWSCEKTAGLLVPHCGACGALLPPDPKVDHFDVLGVERRYDLDLPTVERRYRELARDLHPDRHAKGDPRARRASLQRSVQLNDAWKTLRDPVKRAEYLLALAGWEVAGEEGTRLHPEGEAPAQKVPVSQELLLEVMELREGLSEARASGDEKAIAALSEDVRGRRARALDEVASGFTRGPSAYGDVAAALVSVRYFDRFLDEVAVHEEARLAAAEAAHGG